MLNIRSGLVKFAILWQAEIFNGQHPNICGILLAGAYKPFFFFGVGSMRILLISPRSVFPDVTPGWLRIPQMSLAILEALTPPQHDVRIVEELSLIHI